MSVCKTVMLTSMSVATLISLGCDRHSRDEEADVPQQQQAAEQQAPPPLIVEVQPAPPSVGDVWVAGYWNWSNQRYSWEAGRYVVPPQPDAVWVAPRYDSDAHGNRYTPGQWTKQNQSDDRDHGSNVNPGSPNIERNDYEKH